MKSKRKDIYCVNNLPHYNPKNKLENSLNINTLQTTHSLLFGKVEKASIY